MPVSSMHHYINFKFCLDEMVREDSYRNPTGEKLSMLFIRANEGLLQLTPTNLGLLGGSGSLSEKSQSRGASATRGRGPPGSGSWALEAEKDVRSCVKLMSGHL